MFRSPWMLCVSQILLVLGVGWLQWNLFQAVTLTLPLLTLLAGLYAHQYCLYRWDRLPRMPEANRLYWGIALVWSALLVVIYVLNQSVEELSRVSKVLPILWFGIGFMDWVFLVCMQQLVGHFWDEQ